MNRAACPHTCWDRRQRRTSGWRLVATARAEQPSGTLSGPHFGLHARLTRCRETDDLLLAIIRLWVPDSTFDEASHQRPIPDRRGRGCGDRLSGRCCCRRRRRAVCSRGGEDDDAERDSPDPARGRDPAGEPVVRLVLRHVPGRRRHPDDRPARRQCVCPIRRREVRARRTSITRTSTAAAPTARRTQRPTSTAGRWTASSRKPSRAGRAAWTRRTRRARTRPPRRDGLPHRSATSRTTGPTRSDFVLQDHMFEPNASWSLPGAPVLGVGVVGVLHAARQSVELRQRDRNALRQSCAPAAERAGVLDARTSDTPIYAWTDLTYLLHKHARDLGLLRRQRHRTRLRGRRRARLRAVTPERRTPRGSGTRCRGSTPSRTTASSATSRSVDNFYTAAKNGTLPAVSWVVPSGAVSEHPPATVSAGQSLRDQPRQRGRCAAPTGTRPRSSWRGTTGAASTTTSRRRRSTRTATACASRPSSSARTRRPGYVDHQTLSFDAYDKFIEDDFLDGQRLDPAHRRPTRPTPDRPRGRRRSSATSPKTSTSPRNRAHPYSSPFTPRPR